MESPHLNQDRSEDETIETLRAAILFSVNSTPRNENIDYILQGVRNSGANTEFKTAVAGTLHFFMSYHFHVAIDATLFTIAHHQTCQLPNGWDGEKIILSPLPEIQCAEYLTRFMDQTFKLSLVRTGDLINVNLQHIANGSVFTSDPLDVALVNGFYNENMQLQYAYASIFFHALKHGFQEAFVHQIELIISFKNDFSSGCCFAGLTKLSGMSRRMVLVEVFIYQWGTNLFLSLSPSSHSPCRFTSGRSTASIIVFCCKNQSNKKQLLRLCSRRILLVYCLFLTSVS